jgi:hypothetical protein
MPGERAAVVIETEHARDATEAHVPGHGDCELELLGRCEQLVESLHQFVGDRLVVSHEQISELEGGALALGERRVAGIVTDRLVDGLGNRLLRRRRRTPLESNGTTVEAGHQKAHELAFP